MGILGRPDDSSNPVARLRNMKQFAATVCGELFYFGRNAFRPMVTVPIRFKMLRDFVPAGNCTTATPYRAGCWRVQIPSSLPRRSERTRRRVKSAILAWPARNTAATPSRSPADRLNRQAVQHRSGVSCERRAIGARRQVALLKCPLESLPERRHRRLPQSGRFPADRLRLLAARKCPGHDNAPTYLSRSRCILINPENIASTTARAVGLLRASARNDWGPVW